MADSSPCEIPGHSHAPSSRGGWSCHPLNPLNLHNRCVLTRIGNWVIATYGPMMGLTFAIGFGAAAWFDLATGQEPTVKLAYYLFLVLPAILLGCRAASVLLDWDQLFKRPIATLLKPGYMLQGGVFGAIAALGVMAWWTDTNFLLLLDSGAFAMPLGEALGRVGCHVYGCCWGRPTKGKFGVRYLDPQSKVLRCAPHLTGVRLHPAPMYATAVYTGLFVIFCEILPHRPFEGLIAGLYLCLHPPLRVLLERFRDDDRGRLGSTSMTHTHLYAALMFVGGLCAIASGWWLHQQHGPRVSLLEGVTQWGPEQMQVWATLLNSSVTVWLALIGLVAFLAFGVHYRKVGTWVGNHDA